MIFFLSEGRDESFEYNVYKRYKKECLLQMVAL